MMLSGRHHDVKTFCSEKHASICGMRRRTILCMALICWGFAEAKDHSSPAALPDEFDIGRHTFFDFGPPFDYYEVLSVRPGPGGTSIQRITLTPSGDACTQPATVETKTAFIDQPASSLLGNTNPCAIPEKELRRELKRRKKHLVFSGAEIRIRLQCGDKSRTIHSDILDRDMFDASPNTPSHTSWTMQLLNRLDQALGPGVMEKPIFAFTDKEEHRSELPTSAGLENVRTGKFDVLFEGAPDRPSDLYAAAQAHPPSPTVRLLEALSPQPEDLVLPAYPPLAKMARIEGVVSFRVTVDAEGNATNFVLETGHPMLRGAVQEAAAHWRFPKEFARRELKASVEFATHCPAAK
jgi:TonB family protein